MRFSDLRASPMKTRRRGAEAELEEERRLFLAFRNKSGPPKARLKLDFEKPPRTANKVMAMQIDENAAVIPSSEAFKRKALGGSKQKTDKVRLVEEKEEGDCLNSTL